jgi:hypothetical protein
LSRIYALANGILSSLTSTLNVFRVQNQTLQTEISTILTAALAEIKVLEGIIPQVQTAVNSGTVASATLSAMVIRQASHSAYVPAKTWKKQMVSQLRAKTGDVTLDAKRLELAQTLAAVSLK